MRRILVLSLFGVLSNHCPTVFAQERGACEVTVSDGQTSACAGMVFVDGETGDEDVPISQMSVFSVPQGTASVRVQVIVFSREYPDFTGQPSQFNDILTWDVLAPGTALLTGMTDVNSLHMVFEETMIGGVPGGTAIVVDEDVDVSAIAEKGDVDLTLSASAMNVGDSSLGSGVDMIVTIGTDVTIMAIDTRDDDNAEVHKAPFRLTENVRLVARRGFPTVLTLELDGQAAVGAEPCAKPELEVRHDFDGDEVIIPLPETEELVDSEWGLKSTPGAEPGEIDLAFMAPVDAPVGQYELWLRLVHADTGDLIAEEMIEDLVVLFNPLSANDQVFIDEGDRVAYVTSEQGYYWDGDLPTGISKKRVPWRHNQYSEAVLEVTLQALDGLPSVNRSDVVAVSRFVTANMNALNGGVLLGCWGCEVEPDATDPLELERRSDAVLQPYLDSDGQPTRYGQCWAFAGITTSCLRALGVRTRMASGYEIGWDKDVDGSIELQYVWPTFLFDETNSDLIWNFHVWVESWFEWKGGAEWHVLDSTNMNPSVHDLVLRLGPAPLSRVFTDAGGLYDVDCVATGVDGVRIDRLTDGVSTAEFTDATWIGHCIRSHDVAGGLIDQTPSYKVPELVMPFLAPDAAGREAKSRGSDLVFVPEFPSGITLGEPMVARLSVTNNGEAPRDIAVEIHADLHSYRGDKLEDLATLSEQRAVGPGQTEVFELSMAPAVYEMHTRINESIEVLIGAGDPATGELLYHKFGGAWAHVPGLGASLSPPGGVYQVGQLVTIDVSYTNLLTVPMTGVRLDFAGDAWISFDGAMSKTIDLPDVPSGESLAFGQELSATNVGRATFEVSLFADGLSPFAEFEVEALPCPESTCEGDADFDGDIDFGDINAVLSNWLNEYGPPCNTGPGDADRDGDVDFADITLVKLLMPAACP